MYGRVVGGRQVKGGDHVLLSMATALLCISPFLSSDITAEYLGCSVCFLVGVFGGSNLPDADLVFEQGPHMKSWTGFIYSCLCIGMVFAVRCVYWATGCPFDGRHRCSLHTLYGVSVAVVFICLLTGIFCVQMGLWTDMLIFVFAGLLFGAILHLAGDCCTISGLQPFLPFSPLHLKGGIHTGDSRDRRALWFAKCLVCMTALVIAAGSVYHIPIDHLILLMAGGVVLSWFVFYRFSQHLHTRRR